MSLPIMPQLSRRQFLQLGGGFAALAPHGQPIAALAQTAASAQPVKVATIGAGREGKALGSLLSKPGTRFCSPRATLRN